MAVVNHNFRKDSSIQLFRRLDAENLQSCWRQIDIATCEIICFAALKIWAGSNQCVVHVESAECSVSPLSCRSLPIRVDHPRDVELIFGSVPAKRHHYIRRAIILDVRLLQRKGSLHRLFCKNHSSEIGLLQELNKATRYRGVVSDNIEKDATAVASQHDISRFGFSVEFARRGEAGLVQNLPQIN